MSSEPEMCPRCGGDGKTIVDWERYLRGRHDESDADEFVEECPDCNGTGRRPRPFEKTPDLPTPTAGETP